MNKQVKLAKASTPDKASEKTKQNRKINKQEREKLYEAYNLLHNLAQDFKKPFDAPAVIVIGHQTSGKSALIEALMGFQFNQVGGGTKTRRPVALRMQYNPSCDDPMCFLTLENGKEQRKSLADIQNYIEAENKRLEKDPTRCFDAREISIRVEYKHCPNMIVIDTPGMLHAPKGRSLTPQQRAIAHAAREAEELVLSKIRCQDYIILCVEDTTDWKHSTTRNVVHQVDPELSRTVLVSTKLDTKLPQFSEAADLEEFLLPPSIVTNNPHLLGGPYFTSVPSGRVGVSKEFNSNEAFNNALRNAESDDKHKIFSSLGKIRARAAMKKVGVLTLRTFLEEKVEENYRRNIAKIVPLLQSELRNSENKLKIVEKELNSLSLDRLRQRANIYREKFSKEISNLIHGTVKPNAEDWGETLEAEQLRGGSFLELEQIQSDGWQSVLEAEVAYGQNKLFGGAQFFRALNEFVVAVRHMKVPEITDDEIANSAGLGDVHDGKNFLRASSVIAVEKAKQSFEPMLEALRHRASHVMKRLYNIAEHLNRMDGSAPMDDFSRPFQDVIHRIYEKFVDQQLEMCMSKCRDDLNGMTRYVTWDVDGKDQLEALQKSLPSSKKFVEIYSLAVKRDQTPEPVNLQNKKDDNKNKKPLKPGSPDKILDEWESANNVHEGDDVDGSPDNRMMTRSYEYSQAAQDTDETQLMMVVQEMASLRGMSKTNVVVQALVQLICQRWRDNFAAYVKMKFNCFFLLPFIDEFPAFLRSELDQIYETGMAEIFDIHEARMALSSRRNELFMECEANRKLQERFDEINDQIRGRNQSTMPTGDEEDFEALVDNRSQSLDSNKDSFNSDRNFSDEDEIHVTLDDDISVDDFDVSRANDSDERSSIMKASSRSKKSSSKKASK